MEFEKNIKYIPDDNSNQESIYFIYDVMSKITKIGKTSGNIKARFSAIKTCNPNVTLLLTINRGDFHFIEKRLHRYFNSKHYHGEWFNLDKNDFIYILNKYKDNIKRYKINNLLLELGATEDEIDNLVYVAQIEEIKEVQPIKKVKKSKFKLCAKCGKRLKSYEDDFCKRCDIEITSIIRMKRERIQISQNVKEYMKKKSLTF